MSQGAPGIASKARALGRGLEQVLHHSPEGARPADTLTWTSSLHNREVTVTAVEAARVVALCYSGPRTLTGHQVGMCFREQLSPEQRAGLTSQPSDQTSPRLRPVPTGGTGETACLHWEPLTSRSLCTTLFPRFFTPGGFYKKHDPNDLESLGLSSVPSCL